jgi:glycosyltransferase involved in cell wall biosynthesis
MNLLRRTAEVPSVWLDEAPDDGACAESAVLPFVGQQRPRLAVVVITRDEAGHIAGTLESACRAVRPFPRTQIVVVDSDSTDDTVDVAARFPVEVFRYRNDVRTAAAGRAVGTGLVGADYILFVDGDSCIEPQWLVNAVECLDAEPRVGVVYGQRREIFEGVPADFDCRVPDTPGLGGTALYRAGALRYAGGFHPFIAAEEEGELRQRIERLGFSVRELPELMFTHRTVPKDTWRGYAHRLRRSMFAGCGQVLRASLHDGTFGAQLRRLNRPVLVALYLFIGLLCLVDAVTYAAPWVPVVWAGVGAVIFALLWRRRRDFKGALYIVCDWTLSALGLVVGFCSPLRRRDEFSPVVERLRPAADAGRRWERVRWRA